MRSHAATLTGSPVANNVGKPARPDERACWPPYPEGSAEPLCEPASCEPINSIDPLTPGKAKGWFDREAQGSGPIDSNGALARSFVGIDTPAKDSDGAFRSFGLSVDSEWRPSFRPSGGGGFNINIEVAGGSVGVDVPQAALNVPSTIDAVAPTAPRQADRAAFSAAPRLDGGSPFAAGPSTSLPGSGHTVTSSSRPRLWRGPRGGTYPTAERAIWRASDETDVASPGSDGPSAVVGWAGGALGVPRGEWEWEAGVGPDVCSWLAEEGMAAEPGDGSAAHAGHGQCGVALEGGASRIGARGAGEVVQGPERTARQSEKARRRRIGGEMEPGLDDTQCWSGGDVWRQERAGVQGDPGLAGAQSSWLGAGLRQCYPFFLETGWD